MIIKKTENHYLQDTLDQVERLARTYYMDAAPLANLSIQELFKFVAEYIEYKKDPPGIELVMRPAYTIRRRAGDCDDKAVLFLAYCQLKNIPCGYSIVSQKTEKPYHHIFTYLIIDNKRIDADATYNFNRLGESKTWAKRKDFNFIY